MRTRLRALLGALQPAELVIPSRGLDAATNKVLKAALRNVRTNALEPGEQFWDAEKTCTEVAAAGYLNGAGGALSHCVLIITSICARLQPEG